MKIQLNPNRSRMGVCLLCWIGVIVIIIGAIVIYKMIRFCQRHFPVVDPPPAQTNNAAYGPQDFYQNASVSWVILTNAPGAPVDPCIDCTNAMTFNLTYTLLTNREPQILSFSTGTKAAYTSFETFTNSLSEWGITNVYVTQINPPLIGYSNGVVIFSDATNSRVVVVERTTNFVDWSPMFYHQIEPGQVLETTDDYAPVDRGFYRVRPIQ